MFKAQTINSKNSISNNISPFQKKNDRNAFVQPKINIGKSEFQSQILTNIRQYPSIGSANPDYYVLYGKQFLVEELKNNNPEEDWSWLDEELANMEYWKFIDFRAYILDQPCSSIRSQEVQMFGIDHPSISFADMSILESELQEQEVECLAGKDMPNDSVP